MKKLTVGIPLTRREFLGGAAAGAAALLLPWDPARAETKLQVGTIKIGDLSPFFLAQEKGFFKDANLDINAVAMVGGAAIQPAPAPAPPNIRGANAVPP